MLYSSSCITGRAGLIEGKSAVTNVNFHLALSLTEGASNPVETYGTEAQKKKSHASILQVKRL